jgi:hypothetical protein
LIFAEKTGRADEFHTAGEETATCLGAGTGKFAIAPGEEPEAQSHNGRA